MIVHAFSNRHDGDMRNHENILSFLSKRNVSGRIVLPQQIHGSQVKIVDRQDCVIEGVDGVVTNNNGIILGVRTADCVPLLCFDNQNRVIGVAHAGWRGTYGNIAKNLIDAMQEIGGDPKQMQVILGPHIQSCCYTIDITRKELFSEQYRNALRQNKDSVWVLSLQDVIVNQLIEAGVPTNHIHTTTLCTSCNNHTYFSYRKDSKVSFGEQIAIICIAEYNK